MAESARPVIVLLRGINVGGKNKLTMADLRAIASDCGFADAVTYVQSGNLVLPRARGSLTSIARRLHDDIEQRMGLDIAMIVRSFDEWAAVIEHNPFPDAAGDGTTLHVTFLAEPAAPALAEFDASEFAPEAVAVRGREIYLSLPNGMGRSKLAVRVGRLPGASSGTTRNWNTILKLAALARES